MARESFQNVGILSIGEMGLGIAQVLIAHGYHVHTFAADRSEYTQSRARDAGIRLSPTVEDLVSSVDCHLSIVPPRDAQATAKRILDATPSSSDSRPRPLYYLDLNAIAPATARKNEELLASNPNIILVDGGIIGGVPYEKEDSTPETPNWHCPSLIVSGHTRIPDPKFAQVLNIQHLDKSIGAATGVKMCFGVMTKGFFALAIQAFTTAYELGGLEDLRAYLAKYNPQTLQLAEKGLVTMPPKAYRWVHEMLEMAETMSEDGGFTKELFQGVSETYRVVAEDSELGKELPGKRKRGQTVGDVVKVLSEGIRAKKAKYS